MSFSIPLRKIDISDAPQPALDAGLTGARWALTLSVWNLGGKLPFGIGIGVEQQISFRGEKFRPGGRYYSISLTRHWDWGRHHGYYDGPHDSFSLGFFHINWSGDWCDRCYEGDD